MRTARSPRTTPRSSEPHGNWTVTRSADAASSPGSASAAQTRNRAFGTPPLLGLRAARDTDAAMPAASASMPRTRLSGSRAARASTARPSPVPTSMLTRDQAAISRASYPTSTSTRRRPSKMRMGSESMSQVAGPRQGDTQSESRPPLAGRGHGRGCGSGRVRHSSHHVSRCSDIGPIDPAAHRWRVDQSPSAEHRRPRHGPPTSARAVRGPRKREATWR